MKIKGYGNYPELTVVKRALVVALRNIGDVVLTTPVFRELKRALPTGASIDALVRSGTEDVLEGNPHIDEVITVATGGGLLAELALLRRVRRAHYDLVVVLTTGQRGETLAALSGAAVTVGAPPRKKTLLTGRFPTHAVNYAPRGRHQVERNLDCLRRIGIFPEKNSRGTEIFPDGDKAAKVKLLLAEAGLTDGDRYLAVHPTSRWMFKCWTTEKTAALIDRVRNELDLPVVLTSGPDEIEALYIKDLKAALATDVVDLTARLDLTELGALLAGAAAFFGVDSAPMHMAAAAGTPTVALFGPSIAVDWAPFGEDRSGGEHAIIISDKHECVPCGRDGCGGSKVSECLVDIEVATVFEAVRDRLRRETV